MGYCMDQDDTEFFIAKEDFDGVLKAIKRLRGRETCHDSSGAHFSWVDNDFASINNLAEMLAEWRWEPSFDDEGNINHIDFIGEKMGDDDVLFDAIAPYVKADSYITMRGEDGEVWRWVFRGFSCTEQYGTVIFE